MIPPFFIFIIIAIAIALMIYGHIQAKRRREEMQRIAAKYGFAFYPGHDHFLANQFGFLNHMATGSDRYAYNILNGSTPNGEPVIIFDYHYETYSTDSKGRRTTHHHYHSIFTLGLPCSFSELRIQPEGFFAKIAQKIGFDDIDFESLEFSKRYEVKSYDKKFAYDFCNAQMIDYMLNKNDFTIEVDQQTLALIFKGKLATEMIEYQYQNLREIRALMPEYLFSSNT